MLKPKYLMDKGRSSKWLMMVSLFLTLFSCAGFIGKTNTPQQNRVQTEFVYSNIQKSSKHTVSIKKAVVPVTKNYFIYKTYLFNLNDLMVYNSLEKVKFDNSSHFDFAQYKDRFFQLKTIPQGSTEDLHSISKA